MYEFPNKAAAAHFEASLAAYSRKIMVLSRFIVFFNLLIFCHAETANKKQIKENNKAGQNHDFSKICSE